jgi:hypothetical protein
MRMRCSGGVDAALGDVTTGEPPAVRLDLDPVEADGAGCAKAAIAKESAPAPVRNDRDVKRQMLMSKKRGGVRARLN